MASKLGKALGFSMDEGDASDMDDDTPPSVADPLEDKPKGGSAEILAMKQFERATTTEAKVQALKDFLEACGAIGDEAY